jgi:hypothetical protein
MLKQCLHRDATFREATANGRRSMVQGLRTVARVGGTGGPVAFLSRILIGEKAHSPIPPARVQAVLGTTGMRDHGRCQRP